MDLKDKLNLLWKYLLLAVVVFGIVMLARGPHAHRMHTPPFDFDGMPHTGMGPTFNVKVEKQVTDSDTTVFVWVNGKKIENPEEFLKKNRHVFNSEDHDVMIWNDGHGKIIKKKIRFEEQEDDD